MNEFWRAIYRRVCGIMGTQMGKTDLQCNVLGHTIDLIGLPVMYFGPTKNFTERTWEPRFMAMVNSTPLRKKMARGRQPKTQKTIAGVKASFGWSGSASQLAGETAYKVMIDERDRMKDDVTGEGDPVEMADGRHETFFDGQTGIFSTPTIGNVDVYQHPDTGYFHWEVSDDVASASWKIWQEGTRHEWMVPCPHCAEYFAPRSQYMCWPDNVDELDLQQQIAADESEEDVELKPLFDATLECPHCEEHIFYEDREWMLERGRDVAPGQWVDDYLEVRGRPPRSLTYSLQVSGLCSPWRDWYVMALRWIAAIRSGDPERLQGVLNVQFGELYSYANEAPDWKKVQELRSLTDYRMGDCPVENPICIVMGVDVQIDRLVYIVRAYAHGMQSFLIEHGEIYSSIGGTESDDVWLALAAFKDRMWGVNRIDRVFVDSRYRTSTVFNFVRKHQDWAFPALGSDKQDKPLSRRLVDVNAAGRVVKGGLMRWTINPDYFKRWIHARIEREPELPNQWHLPTDATDDYCKQIVAEARIIKPSGEVSWIVLRKENHYLDCEMLGLACAHSLQVHILAEQEPMPGNVVPGGRSESDGDKPLEIRTDDGTPGGQWFKRR